MTLIDSIKKRWHYDDSYEALPSAPTQNVKARPAYEPPLAAAEPQSTPDLERARFWLQDHFHQGQVTPNMFTGHLSAAFALAQALEMPSEQIVDLVREQYPLYDSLKGRAALQGVHPRMHVVVQMRREAQLSEKTHGLYHSDAELLRRWADKVEQMEAYTSALFDMTRSQERQTLEADIKRYSQPFVQPEETKLSWWKC